MSGTITGSARLPSAPRAMLNSLGVAHTQRQQLHLPTPWHSTKMATPSLCLTSADRRMTDSNLAPYPGLDERERSVSPSAAQLFPSFSWVSWVAAERGVSPDSAWCVAAVPAACREKGRAGHSQWLQDFVALHLQFTAQRYKHLDQLVSLSQQCLLKSALNTNTFTKTGVASWSVWQSSSSFKQGLKPF